MVKTSGSKTGNWRGDLHGTSPRARKEGRFEISSAADDRSRVFAGVAGVRARNRLSAQYGRARRAGTHNIHCESPPDF